MEIHWWWVGLSFLVLRVPNTASVDTGLEPLHDFDLGPLRCCPRPRNSDICPEMNEYIPCTIASEIERRENRIDGVLATYPSFVEANCTATVRKILCEQNFPTCVINPDGSHEVLLPSGNACKQSLEDDCSIFPLSVIEEACSLYEPTSTNYSVGNCSAPIITLNHCTVDWYVPEWILQYVKQIDIELDAARKSTLEFLNENCWEKFKEVRCKSVGRCWAQGTRLELIISNETCDEALSCLDDSNRLVYDIILDCDSLPSEVDRPFITPSDNITTPTTIPTEPTKQSLATMSYTSIITPTESPKRSSATMSHTTPTTTEPIMEHSLATMSHTTTAAFIPLILLTLAIS